MRPEIGKPFALPPVEARPVTCVCANCGHRRSLSPDQSALARVGLFPFRCPDCEQLRPYRRNEGILALYRGWTVFPHAAS